MCTRLQYKYMKLVESSAGKDGELPAAETCALDEGEEDEHFDAVEFKSKGRKFLKKFKKPDEKKVQNLISRSSLSTSASLLFLRLSPHFPPSIHHPSSRNSSTLGSTPTRIFFKHPPHHRLSLFLRTDSYWCRFLKGLCVFGFSFCLLFCLSAPCVC